MKKFISLLLIGMMLVVSMAACEKADVKDNTAHGHEETADVVLRIAVDAREGDAHYKALRQFAKEVEGKTKSNVKVILYSMTQLGKSEDVIEEMIRGEGKVNFVIADMNDLMRYDSKINISGMPFAFADYQEARSFLNGEIQKDAMAGLEKNNMKSLTCYINGFSGLVTNEKMVQEAKHLQGMQIASAGNTFSEKAMKAAGASVHKQTVSEIRDTLGQARWDGVEAPLSLIYENHLYQKQKYYMVTNHSMSASCFLVSNSFFNSLNPEYRKIIQEAAKSSAYACDEFVRSEEQEMFRNIEEKGVRIVRPNLEGFWKKSETMIRNYSSQYGSLTEQLIMWKNQ